MQPHKTPLNVAILRYFVLFNFLAGNDKICSDLQNSISIKRKGAMMETETQKQIDSDTNTNVAGQEIVSNIQVKSSSAVYNAKESDA